jgi:hypothetical protein
MTNKKAIFTGICVILLWAEPFSVNAQESAVIEINTNFIATPGTNLVLNSTSLQVGQGSQSDFGNLNLKFTGNQNTSFENNLLGQNAIFLKELIVDKAQISDTLFLTGLNTNFQVENLINIEKGTLSLGDKKLLLNSGGNIVENEAGRISVTNKDDEMGFIEITRQVPANTTEDFGGVGFELISGSVSPGEVTVKRYHYRPTSGEFPSVNRGIDRVFKIIAENNEDLDATIRLHFRNDEVFSPHLPENLEIYKTAQDITSPLEDITWARQMAENFSNLGYLQLSGVNSFSYWAMADAEAQPLPVSLVSFSANCLTFARNINWVTESEVNNSHFILEKSQDGINWHFVTTIFGEGTTSQSTQYNYKDLNAFEKVFYQLSQVDFDGSTETFTPILADACGNKTDVFSVSPVSPQTQPQVQLYINATYQEEALVEIYSLNGKQIFSGQISLQSGYNLYPINCFIYDYASYFVRVTTQQKTESKKFVTARW